MAMTAKAQTGLDFQELARGGERSYSCSYLVSLDPDLMALTNPRGNYLDQARDALAGHTTRIMEQIKQRCSTVILNRFKFFWLKYYRDSS